jgi:hypothetical protein
MKDTSITGLSWGQMEVQVGSETYRFRDCKVWPGGAKEWDWRLTGTNHKPGIQPADIEEILERDVEVMILSRGQKLLLRTSPETEELLNSRGIEYHLEETKRAVELFNELTAQGKRVGGVFHSTC